MNANERRAKPHGALGSIWVPAFAGKVGFI